MYVQTFVIMTYASISLSRPMESLWGAIPQDQGGGDAIKLK